jgi:hypothetical protein
MTDPAKFIAAFRDSFLQQSFVKLTLGKVRGGTDLKRCVVTPIDVRGERRLKVVTSHARKDVTQIHDLAGAVADVEPLIGTPFLSATLATTAETLTLTYNKRREAKLTRSKAVVTRAAPMVHDRAKSYAVNAGRPYLEALGLATTDGVIKPAMFPKYKQISRYIEIVDDVLKASPLADAASIRIVDIGSGKGYLTFALYDHLTSRRGLSVLMTGIEVRSDLVAFCNDLAATLSFSGLHFEAAEAAAAAVAGVDAVIALHACDTATDDAIFQGIVADAAVIITAPCCQHELAPQLAGCDQALKGLARFGLFRQRQADLFTDAARALLMEAHGYKVKVIEFVSTEHTAKNLMIAGVRSGAVDREAAHRQYEALKSLAGFTSQHLERRLSSRHTA